LAPTPSSESDRPVSNSERHARPQGETGRLLAIGARFVAYFVLSVIAVTLVAAKGGWEWSRLATARVSATLMSATGVHAVLSGTLIRIPNRILAIDLACTGITIVALYCALILAYPVRWSYRLLGIAIGVPAILLANLVRIVAAAHVSATAPSAFTFVHVYLFQVGMVLVVAFIWAGWLSLGRRYAR
jgi:archaeosortase B (VPXXXP-CTERM-specific)